MLEGRFSIRWLWRNAAKIDLFHFHWLSFPHYNRPKASRLESLLEVGRFIIFLIGIRALGSEIIWTAHNLYPHDRFWIRPVDTWVRHLVTGLSRAIFVHGMNAARLVRREFPLGRGSIVILNPGFHWCDRYRNEITRSTARSKLGLNETDFVYLFIGLCRDYKNLEQLVLTFSKLNTEALLLLAGRFHKEDYFQKIQRLVDACPNRIELHPKFVPDDQVQIYLNACNAVVLPYKKILTSGAAMLALGFGRPVVVPRLGNLGEVVNRECGILYDPGDPEGLSKAMQQVRSLHYQEDRIREYALSFDWSTVADKIVESVSPA